MPIKVRLPNGEIAQFPDGMSEDEIVKAIEDSGLGQPTKPTPKHGALYAATTSALKSILPSAAAYGGAVAGGEAAAASGIGWLGGPIGELVATGAGAVIGGTLAELGQRKLMKVAVPDFLKESEQAESENKLASFGGGVLGATPTFGLSPGTTLVKGISKLPGYASRLEPEKKLVKDAITLLGTGAGLGVVSPLAQGAVQGQFTPPTVEGVAENMAAMALLGRPTRLARGLIQRPITRALSRGEVTTGAPDATQERQQQEGSQPERPGTPPLGVPPEAGGSDRPAPAAGLEEKAPLSLETPVFSGSDKFGWTVRMGTRMEAGFPTKKAARDRANEVYKTGKPLAYEVTPETLAAEEEDLKKETAQADEINDQAERAAIDAAEKSNVDLSQKSATGSGENVPFASGQFFKALGGNKVAWNKPEFRRWVIDELYNAGLSREQIMEAVRARVREEFFHNKVEDVFEPQDWQKYWDSLSFLEQRKTIRQYTNRWTRIIDPKTGKPRDSDIQLAKEAFRQRLEEHHGYTPADIEQEMLTARWSLKGLSTFANMVRRAREAVGTGAGLYSREMFDKALRDVDFAMKRKPPAEPPVESPSAARKEYEPETITAAAYRTATGQVETGRHHPEILDRLGVKGFESAESRNTEDFGFQTTKRPFITRQEAGPVATASGQNLKQFEPGENVHSDEVESSAQPGRAVSEEGPAARRKTPAELMELSGERKRTVPKTIEEKEKLDDELTKRGVTINGQHFPYDTPYGYAAGQILMEGREDALNYAKWGLDSTIEGGYPPGSGKRMWAEHVLEATQWLLNNPARLKLGTQFPFPGWKTETQLRLDLPSATGKAREEELLLPKGGFTTRMWMRPDGRLLRVNHLHGITAQEITGIKDGFEALHELRKRGYIHLRIINGTFYVGNEPTPKQLKELKDLAIEHDFRLVNTIGNEYPSSSRKIPEDPEERAKYIEKYGQMSVSAYLDEERRAGRKVLPAHLYTKFDAAEVGDAAPRYPDMMDKGQYFFDIDTEKVVDAEGKPISPQPRTINWMDLLEMRELLNRTVDLGVPKAKGYRAEIELSEDRIRNLYRNQARMRQQEREAGPNYVRQETGPFERPGARPAREQFGPPPEGTPPPEAPAARGKKQRDTGRPNEPMLIPGLTEKGEQAGVGEAPQPVPPEERIVNIIPPTQEQIDAAGRAPPSNMDVSRILTPIVTGEHPDYDLFKDQLKKQFGPRWANEVAPGAFEDGIWYSLTHSAPEKLAQWIGEFKVGPRLGLKRVPRIKEEDIQRVNDPAARAEMRKQMELLKGTPTKLSPETMETLVNRLRTNERFRNTALSTLAREMLKDVVFKEQPRYRAESIEFDDIDFDNPKTEWPGYYEFTPGESESRTALNQILSSRARAGSYAPVSASNRLVALRNRLTGEIELVSVYEHGRDGVVVFRPQSNKYIPIKEVDPNRKFYATILRKEPLQRFIQYFKNTAEFHAHIDRDNAIAQSQPREEEGPQRMTRRIEGSEGIEPSAGVQGPEAELVRLAQGEGTGELLRAARGDQPLTGSEAAALHSVMEEMEVSNLEDTGEMLKILDHMGMTKDLEGRHYQAYSALYKMAGAIMRNAPPETPLTPEQLHDTTLKAAYDQFKAARNKEAFVLDTLLNYGWDPTRFGEPVHATPSQGPPPTTGARELTLPRFVGRPIEEVGQRVMPFEGAKQPATLTIANPGAVSGPEMLPLEVQRAMEKLPEGFTAGPTEAPSPPLDITKVKPTGRVTEYPKRQFGAAFGPEGRVIGPVEPIRGQIIKPRARLEPGGQRKLDLPSASRKYAEEYTDEIKRFGQKILIAGTRRQTDRDIRGWADGAQRTAEAHSIREANLVRLASIGKAKVTGFWMKYGFTSLFDKPEAVKIRKAVAPYYAAMQIAEKEEWERVRLAWRDLHEQEAALRAKHEAVPPRTPETEPHYVAPTAPSAQHFEKLILQARKGMERAQRMVGSPNEKTRITARQYEEGAKELMDLAIFARDNLHDPKLKATAQQFRKVMNDQLQMMTVNGLNIASREHYVPTIYDGEVWDDGMMTWGDNRYLGTQHRMPKVFENYYDAIEAGPYIPVNLDSAVLAQHSVVKSTQQINKMMWGDLLKATTDPESKKPVALSAVWAKVNPNAEEMAALRETIEKSVEEDLKANANKYPTPGTPAYEVIRAQLHEIAQRTLKQKYTWQVPDKAKDYELVQLGTKATPIAVRRAYKSTVEAMLAESYVPELPGGKQALMASQMLKHGVVLLFDTFHPGRLLQYATTLGGKNWMGIRGRPGWRAGWSALSYHPESLPQLVEAGIIPKEAADWALQKIKVKDRGTIKELTRHQLGDIFLSQGLNATQLADALYRSAVQRIPVIGPTWYKYGVSPFTKFTFDRFTPGLIMESAIRNFERLNPGNPKADFRRQVRDVARDINAFYGNMGRQGIFKNPTFRDLAQIFVLAPLWQEGLLRKELTTAMRVTGVSRALGRKTGSFESYLGPISFGVARGIGAYFVLTQLVNLITKGHFTWDNKEKDHKMDAWFGIGDSGVWISPLSVFGEVTHEFLRLYETKGSTWEAATRLGFNKLGPLGRIFNILHDQKTPQGEVITSTAGVAGAAASELLPTPISLGTVLRGAGAAMGVPRVTPNPPGAMLQRGLSAVGVKSMRPTRTEQDVAQMADKFMKASGKKFQPMEMLPTTEPSYTKLRGAIRNKDFNGAKVILEGLRKNRTDKQILHAMRLASTRPFTGSASAEREFLYSLSNQDLDLYWKANLNRAEQYQAFLDWFMRQ